MTACQLTTEENIDKAQMILGEFLAVSKVEIGKDRMEQARHKLEPLVSEVIQAMSPVIAEKKNEGENL